MKNIAIFASGTGTNTRAIIEYFRGHPAIKVALIVSDNPEAGVLKIAQDETIISAIVSKNALGNEETMNKLLNSLNIEMIVLAGFLQLIPKFLLRKFPKRIINIHPALLPGYGGQGMYGMKVHEAVLTGKETETGITIHYTNEKYDEGEIILQKKISIERTDTPDTLSKKIHQLEYEWYPKVIEQVLLSQEPRTKNQEPRQ